MKEGKVRVEVKSFSLIVSSQDSALQKHFKMCIKSRQSINFKEVS